MKKYEFKTLTIPTTTPSPSFTNPPQPSPTNPPPGPTPNKKQPNNLHIVPGDSGQGMNISEMKNKLNQLLRQTQMLAERKNISLGKGDGVGDGGGRMGGRDGRGRDRKGQLSVGRDYLNDSGASYGKGFYQPQRKTDNLHGDSYKFPYKKQEIIETKKFRASESGATQVVQERDQSRLVTSPRGLAFGTQRNGGNHVNFTNINFNGQIHKFMHDNNYKTTPLRPNSEIQGRQFQLHSKISEQKLPISQPSQPMKSRDTDPKQSLIPISLAPMPFSPKFSKQQLYPISNNFSTSPNKSTQSQTQSGRPSYSQKPQSQLYTSPAQNFNLNLHVHDYTFPTSTSISSTTEPQPQKSSQKYQQKSHEKSYEKSYEKSHEKSQQIPTTISECQYKIRTLDQQCQKMKEEIAELADGKEYYRKELSQEWRNNKKLKEEYEVKIGEIRKEHEQQIQKYIQKNIKTIQQYQQKIHNITESHTKSLQCQSNLLQQKQKTISDLITELAIFKQSLSQQSPSLSTSTSISPSPFYESYHKKSNKLIAEHKQIIQKLVEKEKEMDGLRGQLEERDIRIEGLVEKVGVLEGVVKGLGSIGKIGDGKGEGIGQGKGEIKGQSNGHVYGQSSNLDDVLMLQLKTIAEFKQIIDRLNQKNTDLSQKLLESTQTLHQTQTSLKITHLKSTSTLNNLTIQSQITHSNSLNTISTLTKKLQTLQQKYKLAINQIKMKDQFFKQYLIGRTDMIDVKEFVERVLGKYMEEFGGKCQGVLEGLRKELAIAKGKIQLYQRFQGGVGVEGVKGVEKQGKEQKSEKLEKSEKQQKIEK